MGLSIKNPETERLVRELAAQTGETVTRTITVAVQERLEALRQRGQGESRSREIDALVAQIADLPVLDSRSPEEILGYDEQGLPS